MLHILSFSNGVYLFYNLNFRFSSVLCAVIPILFFFLTYLPPLSIFSVFFFVPHLSFHWKLEYLFTVWTRYILPLLLFCVDSLHFILTLSQSFSDLQRFLHVVFPFLFIVDAQSMHNIFVDVAIYPVRSALLLTFPSQSAICR